MRIFLAGAAAAAFAFAATPAFAQYGGSPEEQVEGAPDEAEMTVPADEEQEAMAARAGVPATGPVPDDMDVDPDADVDADLVVDAGGKVEEVPGEDYAAADIDTDIGMDADADSDMDVDPEDAAPPEMDEDAGEPQQGAVWQGEDGRTYCRRSDGTTGLVVGGGAGALIGRGIDGGRHRAAGTIIGGLIGAVVGSAVERSASQQNCR
ncbi:MAG TPA: glycine zipper 2TM domain-containing protein [Allosphingosinicella sp.]|nr:glycine zipper 2TM domain-containing protein [Allosphingosinicella sp.]